MSLTEYTVADSIYHLQNNDKRLCIASRKYLGKFVGITERHTQRIVEKLVAKNIVIKVGANLKTTVLWNNTYLKKDDNKSFKRRQNVVKKDDQMSSNNNTITTNIYKTIERAFRNKFKQQTDEEYRINYAKDRRLMKPLIKKYGEKKIISLIDLWFNDDFGEKCGYTIGGFSSCFNKLLLRANSGEKTKEKNTRKIVDDMEMLRQDKALHPEKYRIPNNG